MPLLTYFHAISYRSSLWFVSQGIPGKCNICRVLARQAQSMASLSGLQFWNSLPIAPRLLVLLAIAEAGLWIANLAASVVSG